MIHLLLFFTLESTIWRKKVKILIKLSMKIKAIAEKTEKINGRLPELIVLVIYCVGHLLMSIVHEPWFDEALAWLIARDSSIKTVLLEATHYEGHPALWHLVLMPFAKSGAPYELSLSIVTLIFTAPAVALILYKAPFKRIIRLLVPFTYFMFYQFSVVARPYCMMILAFTLVAFLYKTKDEKPGRYIGALAFLCATSAYGIVIAGGLCLVWLYEMWTEKAAEREGKSHISVFFNRLLSKGKIVYLSLLLCYVLTILWRIMPAEDAYASMRATKAEAINGPVSRFVYTIFTSVSDLFLTNVYSSMGTLRDTEINTLELWMGAFVGAGILTAIFIYGRRKKKLLTFFVPYLMFTAFASIVYLYYHHIGIELLLIGFWVWICKESGNVEAEAKAVVKPEANADENASEKVKKSAGNKADKKKKSGLGELKEVLPHLKVIIAAIFIIIPLYWSVASCICDIRYSYSYGRHQYEYLRDHDMLDSTIFCEWSKVFNAAVEGYDSYDVSFSMQAVCIAPYLKDNQIYNRMADSDLSYALIHKIRNSEENNRLIENMSQMETPEVILGMPEIGLVYGVDKLNFNDYEKAFEERSGIIWKGIPGASSSCMYIRKDINQ